MKSFVLVVLVTTLAALAIPAFAADIVTVPTANQLKAGQFDLAYYYIGLDLPPGAPENVQVQTLYIGLTNEIELDLHRYDVNNDKASTIVNASVSLLRETPTMPDVVVGARNILQEDTTTYGWDSNDMSYFICAAKTLNLPPSGPPALPIVRLHAGLGTADPSLLLEDRHKGLFGGIQAKLTPEIGLVVLHDATDLITGLTFSPKTLPQLTLKGGTYGDHWWVGLSYAK